MAKTGNTKDIVVRFTGENLLGSTVQGVKRQIGEAARAALSVEKQHQTQRFELIRQSEERALRLRQFYARKQEQQERAQQARMAQWSRVGKKAFGGFGVGATVAGSVFGDSGTGRIAGAVGNIAGGAALGGMAGGPWGAAIGATVAALGELASQLRDSSKNAKDFTEAMRTSRQAFMQGANQKTLNLLEPFRESQKQLLGRDTAPGDRVPLFGGLFSGVGGNRFQRSESFRRAIGQAEHARSKIQQSIDPKVLDADIARITAELVEKEREKRGGTLSSRWGLKDDTQEVIQKARFQARQSVLRQRERARRDLKNLEPDIGELRFRRRLEGGVNIGADVVSGFGASAAQAPGWLGGLIGNKTAGLRHSVGQFVENFQRNAGIMQETASPAEQIRNQMATLKGQLASGQINQEAFNRSRRQLYLGGIGQLGGTETNAPGLAATTGRFITRGPEQKQAEELSAFRREQKEAQREVNRNLLAILREMRDSGDAGGT